MRRWQVVTALAAIALAVSVGACSSGTEERSIDSRVDDEGGPATTAGDDAATTTTTAPERPAEGPSDDDRVTEDAERACSGSDDVVVAGSGLDVELSGDCASLRVEGSGHDIEVDSVGTLVVTGSGQEVEVSGTVGRIELEGSSHRVSYPEPAEVVDDSSSSQVEPHDD